MALVPKRSITTCLEEAINVFIWISVSRADTAVRCLLEGCTNNCYKHIHTHTRITGWPSVTITSHSCSSCVFRYKWTVYIDTQHKNKTINPGVAQRYVEGDTDKAKREWWLGSRQGQKIFFFSSVQPGSGDQQFSYSSGYLGLIVRSVKLSLSTPSANAKKTWIYTSPPCIHVTVLNSGQGQP
jgi:hypothetical protein